MNKVIQARQKVQGFLSDALREGATLDAIQDATSTIVASSDNLQTLDAIIAKSSQGDTLSTIIAKTVSSFPDATQDSIVTALGVASQIAKRVQDENQHFTLDSIENVKGGEVLGSLVAINIMTILSSTLPFVGEIADFVPMQGSKDNVKFQMFTVNPIVKNGMGELEDGEILNSSNAGKAMAFAERDDVQSFVTDTLEYTFDVKKKDGDSDNYPMERGVNEVVINLGNGIFVNDFDAQAMEKTATRTVSVDGVTYTVEFDYDGGKITLKISENIEDGTQLFFSASLSSDKLGEIAGSVGSDLNPTTYVAKPVVINTTVNTLALRQVLQTTGLNLSSNDLMIALAKVGEESKRKKIKATLQFAKPFGAVIDIQGASETTMADRYKHFLVGVEKARADITAKSQITSNVVLVGGSGLVEIFSALSTATNKTNIISDSNNSIRHIGTLNNGYECYYNPLHDTDYPEDEGKHKVFVVGNPADATKRASISGVGLPVLPEDLGFDQTASDKIISLQGKLVVSYNKDKHSRELVRELTVQL